MQLRHLALSLGAICGASALVAGAPDARACGGFFCNAATQAPIYQAGERVLFAKLDEMVSMHIEVMYEGEPTEFGWVLPLPEEPRDAKGDTLPLDKAVGISSEELFDRLQAMTNPSFRINNTVAAKPEACYEEPEWFSAADAGAWNGPTADAAASPDEGGYEPGPPPPPPVVVLQEAKVGPYNAQLIKATGSDELFDWLNENGYYQDPKAKPLLGEYVAKGWVFLGIRLQNGKSTGDLKPLSLQFSEEAPCVPLKITSIAATPNMPIMVWVLGQGRAIPKNYLHAVVNPQALTFPNAPMYVDKVTEAIDTASGHAWVTEFSGPSSTFQGMFLPPGSRDTSSVEAATTLGALLTASNSVRNLTHYQDLLREEIPMPAGMTGYPYGNCYYGNEPWEYYEGEGEGGPDWCPETNEEHQTTEAEFYNFIDYWVAEAEAGKLELSVDLERLRGRILNEVYIPNIAIEELFEKTTTLTRFYTTMDPEEMTKDPLFAFNADLPPVDSQMIVKTTVETDPVDCDEYVVADYPDGNRYTIECSGGDCWGIGTLQPVPGANPLKLVQVLDEWGDPINIDPAKADEVDAILNNAEPGSPSLPPDYEVPTVPAPDPVWPNPPAHADTTGFDTNGDGVADGGAPKLSTGTSGCAAEAGPSLGFLAALLSAALVLLYLRRQRRSLR